MINGERFVITITEFYCLFSLVLSHLLFWQLGVALTYSANYLLLISAVWRKVSQPPTTKINFNSSWWWVPFICRYLLHSRHRLQRLSVTGIWSARPPAADSWDTPELLARVDNHFALLTWAVCLNLKGAHSRGCKNVSCLWFLLRDSSTSGESAFSHRSPTAN